MALVRVYCGLASAYPPRQLAVGSSSLSATIVDDSGRVLDVCEIGDDSYGYAYLSTLLGERATGPYSVAIATDSDQQLVSQLLIAAGWALATVDRESTDEYTHRFTEDLTNERETTPNQRRALGLARALQAGVVSASLLPCAPEFTELKPVLATHSALVTGRYAATVALRETLRELYPAALRAFPDPADPVALAVLTVLPEPSQLATAGNRGRDAAAAADAAAQLHSTGHVDQAAITEAVTALRVSIAETPRRGGVSRSLTTTVAETVRQAVTAVRAFDAAGTALVNALTERATIPAQRPESAAPSAPTGSDIGLPTQRSASTAPLPSRAASRSPAHPAPPSHAPASDYEPTPSYASTLSDPPAQSYGAMLASEVAPNRQSPPEPAAPTRRRRAEPDHPPAAPAPWKARESTYPPQSAAPVSPAAPDQPASNYVANRPVSPPPPPPPGITPIREPRPPRQASRATEPSNDKQQLGGGQLRMPAPRPSLDQPPAGSRSQWPTNPADDDWATSYQSASNNTNSDNDRGFPSNGATPPGSSGTNDPWRGPGGVVPPWQSDDLRQPEQPALRLVEPTLPAELRDELGFPLSPAEPPPLRLVEPKVANGAPRSAPPVSADEDDNLLIFAQTRSAWFDQDQNAPWTSAMDLGWQAAEQAAQPTIGDRTGAGLPRRVPHANLVPGAPPRRDERPLRVVRDPASIAAHTSGYFSGWRRGQEVGGFPLGTRQSRRAAGAWEFHRDEDRLSG